MNNPVLLYLTLNYFVPLPVTIIILRLILKKSVVFKVGLIFLINIAFLFNFVLLPGIPGS